GPGARPSHAPPAGRGARGAGGPWRPAGAPPPRSAGPAARRPCGCRRVSGARRRSIVAARILGHLTLDRRHAMPMDELAMFMETWDGEAGPTATLLHALPQDQYDFRPDAHAPSPGQPARHPAPND